jgi:hypothetical protein
MAGAALQGWQYGAPLARWGSRAACMCQSRATQGGIQRHRPLAVVDMSSELGSRYSQNDVRLSAADRVRPSQPEFSAAVPPAGRPWLLRSTIVPDW